MQTFNNLTIVTGPASPRNLGVADLSIDLYVVQVDFDLAEVADDQAQPVPGTSPLLYLAFNVVALLVHMEMFLFPLTM